MNDSLTRSTVRPLLPAVADAISKGDLTAIPGWSFEYSKRKPTAQSPTGYKFTGHHEGTGLYVHGIPTELRGWTASMPGLLHGFNGIQLKSDSETACSFDKAHAILNEISTGPCLIETYRRLNVALNLYHPEPQRLVSALRNARHPWIRKETEKYADGSIRYPGTEVVFQAYWKLPAKRTSPKRKAWHTPEVLRLELQLKTGAKIAQFLNVGEPPITHLPPVATLYRRFREFMLGFPPCHQGAIPCSMAALLALCESRELCLPGGETVMDWHRRSIGRSAHYKMRSKVAVVSAQFLEIDWGQLLPPDSIPATMDVHLDGTTTLVPPVPITPSPTPVPVRFGDQQPEYT